MKPIKTQFLDVGTLVIVLEDVKMSITYKILAKISTLD